MRKTLLVLWLNLALALIGPKGSFAEYKEAVVLTTFKQVCHTQIQAVESGTVKDPETNKEVPVYTDTEVEVCEDRLEPDIPVPIYHYTFKSLGKDVTFGKYKFANKDKEILGYIHVKDEDFETLKKWKGYIGDDWEAVKADKRFQKHWTLTKEDYLATSVTNELTQEVTVTKYNEADKAETVPIYPCMLKTAEVKPLSVAELDLKVIEK